MTGGGTEAGPGAASNGASANGAGADEPRSEPPLRLGGMALRNGLLIHGPTSWAVAARGADGAIEVASGPKPRLTRGALGRVPVLRGPLRLAEGLAVIPLARARLGSARLPFENPAVAGATAASMLASGALRRVRLSGLVRELALAALGALPALAALRERDLAAYHAVEHKVIGAHETGGDPAAVPKEHPRCGSNLIVPAVALSLAGQLALERLPDEPGPAARALAGTLSLGAAVELFAYAERHPDSTVGVAIHVPGHEIQRRLSTREPTPEQLEVGIVALNEILRCERRAAGTV